MTKIDPNKLRKLAPPFQFYFGPVDEQRLNVLRAQAATLGVQNAPITLGGLREKFGGEMGELDTPFGPQTINLHPYRNLPDETPFEFGFRRQDPAKAGMTAEQAKAALLDETTS